MPDIFTHIIGGEGIINLLSEGFSAGKGNDYSDRNNDYPDRDNDYQDRDSGYQDRDSDLTDEFTEYIECHKEFFNFACQGPDFFFYSDFWPWKLKSRGRFAGIILQLENVREYLVESMVYIKNCREKGNTIDYQGSVNLKGHHEKDGDWILMTAYMSGFLSHYAFDKNFHPFINKKSIEPSDHKRLEILLDCYFVDKLWGLRAYDLLASEAIDFADHLPEVLITYYRELLRKVHNVEGELDFIDDSYRDMKRFFPIIYRPDSVKKFLMWILDIFIKEDISSLLYPENPDYNILTEEEWALVDKLYNRAVEEGYNFINLMLTFFDNRISREELTAALPRINFNGDSY